MCLQSVNPDLNIIISRDPEGNGFWSIDAVDDDVLAEPYDGPRTPAVVIWAGYPYVESVWDDDDIEEYEW